MLIGMMHGCEAGIGHASSFTKRVIKIRNQGRLGSDADLEKESVITG